MLILKIVNIVLPTILPSPPPRNSDDTVKYKVTIVKLTACDKTSVILTQVTQVPNPSLVPKGSSLLLF